MIRQPCNNDNTTLQTTPDLSDHDTVATVALQNKQCHNRERTQLLHKQQTVSAKPTSRATAKQSYTYHRDRAVVARLSHGCRAQAVSALCHTRHPPRHRTQHTHVKHSTHTESRVRGTHTQCKMHGSNEQNVFGILKTPIREPK